MTSRQVEVLPGTHLVASTAGVLIVVAHRDREPATPGSPAARALDALVRLARQAADTEPGRSGRLFARLATKWVIAQDDEPEFGVLSPADTGIAVFLHGGVTAEIIGGTTEVLRGQDAGFTVDRVVDEPAVAAGLFVDEGRQRPTTPAARGVSSLVEGIAPGAGAVLWVGEAAAQDERAPGLIGRALRQFLPPTTESQGGAAPDRPRPHDAAPADREPAVGLAKSGGPGETATPRGAALWHESEPDRADAPLAKQPAPATEAITEVEEPDVDLEDLVVLRPPALSARIDTTDVEPELRKPLPVANARAMEPTEIVAGTPDGVVVKGFKCARGHLNDPRVSFCSVCGIRMDQLTGILADGIRPPLGLLVLDDGTTFVLDADCVLGRDPERSEPAQQGLRPIRIEDSSGGMSRAHAEVRLVDWDVLVIDRGSTNGTHVRRPGQYDWVRAQAGEPVTLVPGAEVMLGNRIVSFDSPHGQL